ncbi:hypothetical protein DFJ77DRAFT_204532 [Powellomyces hirtus]|nr:hypothetical protein DFJ77DRAFT_204532 [Powellomyces hirtus]
MPNNDGGVPQEFAKTGVGAERSGQRGGVTVVPVVLRRSARSVNFVKSDKMRVTKQQHNPYRLSTTSSTVVINPVAIVVVVVVVFFFHVHTPRYMAPPPGRAPDRFVGLKKKNHTQHFSQMRTRSSLTHAKFCIAQAVANALTRCSQLSI